MPDQDADAAYWKARSDAVVAASEVSGAAWDAAMDAWKRDWCAAFVRCMIRCAGNRYDGGPEQLRIDAEGCAAGAFDSADDHTPAEAAEAEWHEWCLSA